MIAKTSATSSLFRMPSSQGSQTQLRTITKATMTAAPSSRGVGHLEGWVFRQALGAYLETGGDPERLRAAFFRIGGEVDRLLAGGGEPPSPAEEPFRRASGGSEASAETFAAQGGEEAVDPDLL